MPGGGLAHFRIYRLVLFWCWKMERWQVSDVSRNFIWWSSHKIKSLKNRRHQFHVMPPRISSRRHLRNIIPQWGSKPEYPRQEPASSLKPKNNFSARTRRLILYPLYRASRASRGPRGPIRMSPHSYISSIHGTEQTGAADAYKRHQCRLFIYYIYITSL